jgi:biopolymer transport protein ExbD
MKLRRTARRGGSEPMLPMINVVFLLLIFFMLLANVSVYVPFPVEPPDAERATSDRTGFTIAIAADGRVALNGREVEDGALAASLPLPRGDTPEPVWLKADRAAEADRVIAVMERLRAAGVTEVRLIAAE